MSIPSQDELCPDCGHRWAAHQGRKFANKCCYRPYADYRCPCARVNPRVEAEGEMARAAWHAYMGYGS